VNSRNQSYIIYILLFIAIITLVVYNVGNNGAAQGTMTINELAQAVNEEKVAKIVGDENRLTITMKGGEQEDVVKVTSTKDSSATLVEQLIQFGVSPEKLTPNLLTIEIKAPSPWVGILTALGYILPFLLLAGAFFFIFRPGHF